MHAVMLAALLSVAPGAGPTTRPAEPYPPARLVAACREQADAVRRQLGPGVRVTISAPFVIAGDVSAAKLAACTKYSVVRPANAMWTAYFAKKPRRPITILLFSGGESYARYARRDYPRGGQPYFGYFIHADRRMVMNIATGTGTLVHELTHALIAPDFPEVPTWFNEGLASLHEQCSVREKTIVGLTNWRLPILHAAIRTKTLRPLRELVTKRDFYGPRQGVNYARARYFVMYMQSEGVLRGFYKHFRAHHEGKGADVRAIERAFGRDIETVEKAFLTWAARLRFRR